MTTSAARGPAAPLAAAWEQIDRDFDSHIDAVRRYLRQPSVSKTGEGIAACADLTAELVTDAGGRAELVPTDGNPAIVGRLDGTGPRLLRYGMYDVQPAEERDWQSSPWSADIRDARGIGPCIVARGAVNSKGALAAFLLAISSLQKVGDLPVALRFLIDGEEELGSPHLHQAVERERSQLEAEGAVDLDLTADAAGTPEVYLGTKGILSYVLTCEGGRWGGPTGRAAHSSTGVLLHSPTWSLVRALNALVDEDERIKVPGIEHDAPVPDEDRALVERLAETVDVEALKRELGAQLLKVDEPLAVVRALLYEPACNVNGIETGYAHGGKTIVPHTAKAAIDLRVPYGSDLDAIDEALRRAVGLAAPEVVVTEEERCIPARTPSDTPVARAMIESHVDEGHAATVWPGAPWWAPYHLFEQVLQVPFAVGGAGHGAGAHAANEYITVEGVRQHMRQAVALLFRFAELEERSGVE